jgi:signal transduction histidine kinase
VSLNHLLVDQPQPEIARSAVILGEVHVGAGAILAQGLVVRAPGGAVGIDCAGEEERVTIHVRDTGIGIPHAKQSVVFDPFVQVHRGAGAPLEGVGLGLAISRGLARGMGGDLTVNSEPGAGSTFELALARATVDAQLT